ncbi:hypothetical protein FNV43_RR17051 [Rhamnella rubrinervis]|uniref:Retrotransposon gag domain-containing protein n=1 Tax=Rhamnella rubrinervis TaxID=2594499 RepID=A0A8K0H001_9ROSA|nr:hypothetical protein FNV43_RR17051 [Rhamnella rubrinervis]
MKKQPDHLILFKHGKNESLDEYIRRFNDEPMQVKDFTDQAIVQAMMPDLQLGAFKQDIAKYHPNKLSTMIEEVQKHVNTDQLAFIRGFYMEKNEPESSPSKPLASN